MLKFRNGLLCGTFMSGVGEGGGGGHLSVADAISQLDAADVAASEKKNPTGTDGGAADQGAQDGADDTELELDGATDGDASDTDTDATTSDDGSEGDSPGDAETEADEEDEAEAPAIEAPRWWSNDKKALFKQLSPELQAVVLEQENVRERVVSKAKQESADARKAAEAERQKFTHQLTVIEPLVKQAQDVFKDRWAGVDWTKAAEELTPEQYQRARAQFEKDQDTINRLRAAQMVTAKAEFEAYTKEQGERLKTVAPELVDEKLGSQRRTQLANFLVKLNVPAERISAMSADEAALAYDAMRWRMAQAKAAQARKQKTPQQQQQQRRPQVRPSAPRSASSQDARLKALEDAFNRDPSTKNLEAWLNAKG